MDSFELNKIAGAVLGTALLVMALSITISAALILLILWVIGQR